MTALGLHYTWFDIAGLTVLGIVLAVYWWREWWCQ